MIECPGSMPWRWGRGEIVLLFERGAELCGICRVRRMKGEGVRRNCINIAHHDLSCHLDRRVYDGEPINAVLERLNGSGVRVSLVTVLPGRRTLAVRCGLHPGVRVK